MVSGGYSARQIALHWIVFALVAFQFVMGGAMTHLFQAGLRGPPTDIPPIWAPIHIVVGDLILLLMLARLLLRRRDGVPPPAKQHPALQGLAAIVHAALYVDLIGAPIAGAIAYFGQLPAFASLHHLMVRPILIVLVGLHVAGALWHWLAARDGVMMRMLRPARQ